MKPLPKDGTIPRDQINEISDIPNDPPLETEIDDDEGGADAIDPDTGLPYDEADPGEVTLPADRLGGTSD